MNRDSTIDAIKLLPLVVVLWLGYLLALLLIDHVFFPIPIFAPSYYLISGALALIVLGLTLFLPAQDRTGKGLLILTILLLSLASILLGEQCGVCHGKVAFPVSECRKCHSKNKPKTAKK